MAKKVSIIAIVIVALVSCLLSMTACASEPKNYPSLKSSVVNSGSSEQKSTLEDADMAEAPSSDSLLTRTQAGNGKLSDAAWYVHDNETGVNYIYMESFGTGSSGCTAIMMQTAPNGEPYVTEPSGTESTLVYGETDMFYILSEGVDCVIVADKQTGAEYLMSRKHISFCPRVDIEGHQLFMTFE